MLKKLKYLPAAMLLSMVMAGGATAGDVSVNLNEGRFGEPKRVEDPTEFKVCADPDNLPYTNTKQEGFENKIAELLAKDLGKKLSYQFWYDRFGFLRNTISANRCDVIMSTTSDNDALLTSKPYYRSGHVFIYKKSSGYNIADWDSPDLRKAVIGIVGEGPATRPLSDHGLIDNGRPYRLQRDLNDSPGKMIDDLVKGEIDVAVLWGPIGGYYAKQAKEPLIVVPVPEYEGTDARGKEYWNISIGVRKRDKERMAMIQGALDRNHDKILKILDEYGVPHVPVVEGDSIVKTSHAARDAAAKSE
jgi:mxaJ protein